MKALQTGPQKERETGDIISGAGETSPLSELLVQPVWVVRTDGLPDFSAQVPSVTHHKLLLAKKPGFLQSDDLLAVQRGVENYHQHITSLPPGRYCKSRRQRS